MAFSGAGTGTKADPYQVRTAAQLAEVNDDLTAHYIQVADISQVADFSMIGGTFSGSYDGQGFTLLLNIISANVNRAGLFDGITGIVQRISLFGTINGTASDGTYGIGHVFGGGVIRNCYVNSAITCQTDTVGFGIANGSNATVEDCLFTGTITDAYEFWGVSVWGIVTTSYYDIDVAGYGVDGIERGLATAQLRGNATLPTGFDPAIWTKDATPGDTYPYSYPRLIKEDERNFVMSDTLNTETNRVTGYGGSKRVTIPASQVIRGGTGTDGSGSIPCKEAYLQAPFGNTALARVTIGTECTSVTGVVVPNCASIPATAGAPLLPIPINDLANLYFYGTAADVIDILYRR